MMAQMYLLTSHNIIFHHYAEAVFTPFRKIVDFLKTEPDGLQEQPAPADPVFLQLVEECRTQLQRIRVIQKLMRSRNERACIKHIRRNLSEALRAAEDFIEPSATLSAQL